MDAEKCYHEISLGYCPFKPSSRHSGQAVDEGEWTAATVYSIRRKVPLGQADSAIATKVNAALAALSKHIKEYEKQQANLLQQLAAERQPHKNESTEPVEHAGTTRRGSPSQNHDGLTEARQHLCQAANLYNLCVKAVDKMIAPELPLTAQNSDMFQAATGTLFIEASRAGLVDKMPKKPVNGGNDKAEEIPSKEEPDWSE